MIVVSNKDSGGFHNDKEIRVPVVTYASMAACESSSNSTRVVAADDLTRSPAVKRSLRSQERQALCRLCNYFKTCYKGSEILRLTIGRGYNKSEACVYIMLPSTHSAGTLAISHSTDAAAFELMSKALDFFLKERSCSLQTALPGQH